MLMVGHWHQYEECQEESALQHTAKGCTLKAVVIAHLQILIEIFYFKHFNIPKCCSLSGQDTDFDSTTFCRALELEEEMQTFRFKICYRKCG